MTPEPLYHLPAVTKGIPAKALAKEDQLRAIRAATTLSERLDAYRRLVGTPEGGSHESDPV